MLARTTIKDDSLFFQYKTLPLSWSESTIFLIDFRKTSEWWVEIYITDAQTFKLGKLNTSIFCTEIFIHENLV